ncbi:MAG: hypothetical protein DWQ07_19280 [Chloroflexi bacterium]|nr:MAG: hypothetical protein DWQ07_19280 [Chloroflexota bacterium]MBL1195076.1 sigma-70 family RNA polymerase sigma factor [Chloroflexota bacterium]NOH12363.1 sigma-70 family RNA polymerase sigma factor [Chloroflexota bacterium]
MSNVMISDAQLAQQAAEGNQQAFAALFETYFQAVYNFALSLTNQSSQAEELTQEAFVRAYEKIDTLGPPWNFRSWIFRMTHNLAIDAARRGRGEAVLEEEGRIPSSKRNPEKQIMSEEIGAYVRTTLQQLPERYRNILVFREMYAFPYQEIAEIMEITLSNAKVLAHRAREMFSQAYGIQLLLVEPTGDCVEFAELVHDLHDDEPLGERERSLKRHLKHCEQCQERRNNLLQVANIFASVFPVLPPSGLRERIYRRMGMGSNVPDSQRPSWPARLLTVLTMAGGAALLIFFSVVGLTRINQAPEEDPAAAAQIRPSSTAIPVEPTFVTTSNAFPGFLTATPTPFPFCLEVLGISFLSSGEMIINVVCPGAEEDSYLAKVAQREFVCTKDTDYPGRLFCRGPKLAEGLKTELFIYGEDNEVLHNIAIDVPLELAPSEIPGANDRESDGSGDGQSDDPDTPGPTEKPPKKPPTDIPYFP